MTASLIGNLNEYMQSQAVDAKSTNTGYVVTCMLCRETGLRLWITANWQNLQLLSIYRRLGNSQWAAIKKWIKSLIICLSLDYSCLFFQAAKEWILVVTIIVADASEIFCISLCGWWRLFHAVGQIMHKDYKSWNTYKWILQHKGKLEHITNEKQESENKRNS